MKGKHTMMWLLAMGALFLGGCAGMGTQPLTFTPEGFSGKQYMARADNFQIVVDASQTMVNRNGADLQSAKNLVGAINWSLPADLPANAGLRSFGHSEQQSKLDTELVYGMARYSRDGLKQGLDKIRFGGGNSPLGAAISAAGGDLEKAAGTSALVIISDGVQNNMDDAVGAAKALKGRMGDRLCIYTVWVGDDEAGRKVLEQVAAAGGCGFATTGQALTGQKELAGFVEKVFLKQKPAPPVVAPAPPPPPAPAPPPPPAPAPVPPPVVKKEVITFNLLFDFDKAAIKDEMLPALERARAILNEDSKATFLLAGHTCSKGTDAYNQGLSERRAAAVKAWLVKNGVAAERLETIGYGEKQPKFDNSNEDGRKLNRRVEMTTR